MYNQDVLIDETVEEVLNVSKPLPNENDLVGWREVFRNINVLNTNVISSGSFSMTSETESYLKFTDGYNRIDKVGAYKVNITYQGYINITEFNSTAHYTNKDLCQVYSNATPSGCFIKHEHSYAKLAPWLDGLVLDAIRVADEEQGKGRGGKLLQEICDKADTVKTKIYLWPVRLGRSKNFLLDDQQLREWYTRYGWVNCLPIYEPVKRVSHFRGGDSVLIKEGYMCRENR